MVYKVIYNKPNSTTPRDTHSEGKKVNSREKHTTATVLKDDLRG